MVDWHQQIEQVFRLIDREIWIVTAAAGPRRGGLVATWVTRASLDPQAPLVMVGLAPNHYTTELVLAAGAFGLHLVSRDQLELVWQFALGSGRDRDKLAGIAVTAGETGAPILSACVAWLDCRVVTTYDSGDRIFFWADVVRGQRVGPGRALTESELIAASSPEQLAAVRQDLAADIDRQRPLRLRWRRQFEKKPPQ